jgi:hypothetical protein
MDWDQRQLRHGSQRCPGPSRRPASAPAPDDPRNPATAAHALPAAGTRPTIDEAAHGPDYPDVAIDRGTVARF